MSSLCWGTPGRFGWTAASCRAPRRPPAQRRDAGGFLATALAHLDYGGLIIAEVYAPTMDWAAAVGRTSRLGPVEVTVVRAELEGADLDAEVRYRLGDRSWHQRFVARMRDESDLRELLAESRFAFDGWLDARRGWFVARRGN